MSPGFGLDQKLDPDSASYYETLEKPHKFGFLSSKMGRKPASQTHCEV